MSDDRQGHIDVWSNKLSAEERSFYHIEMFGLTDAELKEIMTDEQIARYKAWLANKLNDKEGTEK